MKEERISYELAKLNKRYLDLYYTIGVYEERKTPKKIIGYVWKRVKTGRIKELFHFGRLFLKRRSLNEQNDNDLISYDFPENVKVVVYTCITNNYDTLKEPVYINDRLVDFIAFTDFEIPADSAWRREDISKYDQLKDLKPNEINRYVKLHPHEFLSEYDYSVYIDGSLTVMADVMPLIGQMGGAWLGVHSCSYGIDCIYDEAISNLGASKNVTKDAIQRQINDYKKDGYPKHNGLFENTLLIRKHGEQACIKAMSDWWNQLTKYVMRDQMSLNYVLWKNNITKDEICILGDNVYRNPRFYWQPHRDYVLSHPGEK